MKLRQVRLANGGGDMYHPDIPVSVSFSHMEIELPADLDISKEPRLVWLTDKKLRKYMAYRGYEGLQVIRLTEVTNASSEDAE